MTDLKTVQLPCVGQDTNLLRSRCAVLACSDFDAESCTPLETKNRLASKEYDAIIVSALMSDDDYKLVLAAARSTPSIVLSGFTPVPDLLSLVAGVVQRAEFVARTN